MQINFIIGGSQKPMAPTKTKDSIESTKKETPKKKSYKPDELVAIELYTSHGCKKFTKSGKNFLVEMSGLSHTTSRIPVYHFRYGDIEEIKKQLVNGFIYRFDIIHTNGDVEEINHFANSTLQKR
ncbi:MAG: hypothetical protein MJ237_05995 [bacterium]|nr:hypothetical protein [bacterium]